MEYVVVRGPKFGYSATYVIPQNSKIKLLKKLVEDKTNHKNVTLSILGQKSFLGDLTLVNQIKTTDIIHAQGISTEPVEPQPLPQVAPQLSSPSYVNLASSLYDLYTNPAYFPDLELVARDSNAKEHVITAHRFILDAFAPSFLQLLLTSTLSIEDTKSNEPNNNNNTNVQNSEPANTNETKKIHRVYCNGYDPRIVKLFLEYVYTLSIKSFGNTSHEEMIAYKSMLTEYTREYNSIDQRAYLLETQVNSPTYADVVFACDDGRKVYAHKGLLSAVCPVFRAMFDTNVGLIESRQFEVALPSVNADALINIFRYIYTANETVDPQVAVEVLLLADQYCLRHLKYAAQVMIRSALLVENVCDFAGLAHQTNSSYLLTGCVEFIEENLHAVALSEGFHTLDSDIIEKVAARIISRISTNYDPAVFITEILSTIQQMKGTMAVEQCSKLLTDLCSRIGKSKEQDQLYTSNIRSDLLKDKFEKCAVPFEEIKHASYLTSQTWINSKSRRSPFHNQSDYVPVTVTSLMAGELKVEVPLVMKNLVFWWREPNAERSYVTVLTCGDQKIDCKKLDEHLKLGEGIHSGLADSQFVFKVTGASALNRRIPPFGFRRKIKTIIEKHVFSLPFIYVPTGREETTWRLPPSSLVSMLDKLGVEHETVELL